MLQSRGPESHPNGRPRHLRPSAPRPCPDTGCWYDPVHGNHRRPGPKTTRDHDIGRGTATSSSGPVLERRLRLYPTNWRRLAARAQRRGHSVWIPSSFMPCDWPWVQLKEALRACWHQHTVLSIPFVLQKPTTKPVTVAQHRENASNAARRPVEKHERYPSPRRRGFTRCAQP